MEFFIENINLELFLPLLMCAIVGFNALLSNKIDKTTLFLISAISSVTCLIFSVFSLIFAFSSDTAIASEFQWIASENVNFYLGTYLDKISVCFLTVVCLLNFCLQILAYLRLKEHFQYSKLLFLQNFFTFSFVGIVISPNLFQSYLFCELLGVASYLLINFDFSNREDSKAGIKSFIYNRFGDLTLLFCTITLLYFSVVFNETENAQSLAYSGMDGISSMVNSLLSTPLFVLFCSLLIMITIMKFMQAFIYITFEKVEKGALSRIIFYQNSLTGLIGLFLFLRLNSFFFELGQNWSWTVPVLAMFFVVLFLARNLFLRLCNFLGWVEKYIVETFVGFAELSVRGLSYMSSSFQRGNFQSYLIFSFMGLILILGFVLLFYEFFIKL